MFNAIVARAIVADRVAAAEELARLRQWIAAAEPKPDPAHPNRRRWPFRIRVRIRPRADAAVPANLSG